MGDIELEMRKSVNGGKLILFDAWNMMRPTDFNSQQIGNCVLREHYVPSIPVIPPTIEVDEHEDDTVEPECEAYDNGLDPELDYPGIESECVSTEEEENNRLPDVQGDVVENQIETVPQQSEFNFIKVECT